MRAFIREVFSEDGQGSYSRVFSGVIVSAVLFWGTYELIRFHGLPDLGSMTAFLGVGVGSHYGSNKLPDVVSAFQNWKNKQ